MSSQKKVKREIKELKYNFYGHSQFTIKEEICPLILSKVTNFLLHEGKVLIIILYVQITSFLLGWY